jgi:hypothetical protein
MYLVVLLYPFVYKAKKKHVIEIVYGRGKFVGDFNMGRGKFVGDFNMGTLERNVDKKFTAYALLE